MAPVQAFGIALTGERGWSLVFSGDTRPCAAITAAAKDATVLIHEARLWTVRRGPELPVCLDQLGGSVLLWHVNGWLVLGMPCTCGVA